MRNWHAAYGSDYPYVTNDVVTVYNGWMLWAAGVRRAGSLDRDKVITGCDPATPLSHAALICLCIQDQWPQEDAPSSG